MMLCGTFHHGLSVTAVIVALSCVVGWWAVSSWIPLFAGQNAARAGLEAQHWAALTGLVYNLGMIVGYLAFGVLADAWGRKPTTWVYYLGSFVMVVVLFQLVHDPGLLLVAAAVNGFFTSGIFAWMPIYLLVMQKRVYGQGWIMTGLKYCVLGTAYLVLISIGAGINVLVSLVNM